MIDGYSGLPDTARSMNDDPTRRQRRSQEYSLLLRERRAVRKSVASKIFLIRAVMKTPRSIRRRCSVTEAPLSSWDESNIEIRIAPVVR
jgi:hypothetical protein